MKEKYLVRWKSNFCSDTLEITFDNLSQVIGGLTAIKDLGGDLLLVKRCDGKD